MYDLFTKSLNCWVYGYTLYGNSVGILTVVGKHIGRWMALSTTVIRLT